jgi:hypothetical protein
VQIDRFDIGNADASAVLVCIVTGRFTEGVGPVGAGLAQSEAAAAAAVLPGRDCIRRKTICSNRRNHARVQLLNVR